MTVEAVLACVGAVLCSSVVVGVMWRDSRALVSRAFALGMLVLTLREACVGLEALASLPSVALRWKWLGWLLTTMLPGSWLLFILSFARSNAYDVLGAWKWGIAAALALPFLGSLAGGQAFLRGPIESGPVEIGEAFVSVATLGWAGHLLLLWSVLLAVAILWQLEETFRALTRIQRWYIKFVLLGVSSLFAVHIYTASQALLFAMATTALQTINSWAVLVADLLILIALARQRLMSVHVRLSQTALYHSMTVLLVGMYLLAVGILTKVISTWGDTRLLPLGTFFVFVALVVLAVVLLSDQFRQECKRWLNRHLYQARHDYRHIWTAFTERTTAGMDITELCTMIVKMISETFGVPSVTLWLCHNETHERLLLGASTVLLDDQGVSQLPNVQGLAGLLHYLHAHQVPIDVMAPPDRQGQALCQTYAEIWRQAHIRYGVTLRIGQECLGMLTLHDRLTQEAFTLEDQDLLKTLADQAAASLRNLQLTQRLVQAQQMETLQMLSAFFVHDLKNLTAKLALTLQNFPMHYENPAFRNDMQQMIADSIAKINIMCSRLTQCTQPLELRCTVIDLNALVQMTLADLKPALRAQVVEEYHPVPRLSADAEQLQKVVVNLVLNAHDAVYGQGEIRVVTSYRNNQAVLTVHDNGCGMSREFIDRKLFQPFQTTKRQGLGIGLFHSKRIVEAHQGRLEVESVQGVGSTFRLCLRCCSNTLI